MPNDPYFESNSILRRKVVQYEDEVKRLRKENAKLKKEVDGLKGKKKSSFGGVPEGSSRT